MYDLFLLISLAIMILFNPTNQARKLATLNSLDRFIVEAQLMIYSTHFLYFGVTSIHPFVRHGRLQLQGRLKALLKAKSNGMVHINGTNPSSSTTPSSNFVKKSAVPEYKKL